MDNAEDSIEILRDALQKADAYLRQNYPRDSESLECVDGFILCYTPKNGLYALLTGGHVSLVWDLPLESLLVCSDLLPKLILALDCAMCERIRVQDSIVQATANVLAAIRGDVHTK